MVVPNQPTSRRCTTHRNGPSHSAFGDAFQNTTHTAEREREANTHTHTHTSHIIHTHHTHPPKFGAARWVLRRIASNQQNTKLLLIPSCFREPQPTTHDTPHHTIPTIKYSQNVGWSRSDWIVESIQIYYSMEYIILYISCTFSHVIVLYYCYI